MNREKELEKILVALFTLAPNVRQKDWNKAHEMYCNLSTITQQPLSGSDDKSSSPKVCPECIGSGRIYMSAEDGDGFKCKKCNGTGQTFR